MVQIKLFSDVYLIKFLDTSAEPFFHCICIIIKRSGVSKQFLKYR